MNTFETSATVGDQGRILVAGVPFAPGTEVEISISAKANPENEVTTAGDEGLAASRVRMRELFQTVKGFRMAPKLSREELHDRRSLR